MSPLLCHDRTAATCACITPNVTPTIITIPVRLRHVALSSSFPCNREGLRFPTNAHWTTIYRPTNQRSLFVLQFFLLIPPRLRWWAEHRFQRGLLISLAVSLFRLFVRLFLGGQTLPFAPAVEVDQRLHAAPFGDFAFHPHKVDRL